MRARGKSQTSDDGLVLAPEQMIEAYRLMLLSRLVDERAVNLQRQGRIPIHAPVTGQEASVVGSALALDPERDWLVPQYREFPAYVRQGLPLEAFWLNRLGLGPLDLVPPDTRILPSQIAIAANVPQAMGIAWGQKIDQTSGVTLVYFGDGATSEGDFHEGANFAGVMKVPLILLCQNNGWAITTPTRRQTAAASIADKAAGYGMPGVTVDGNDVGAVYEATAEAVARARAGEGPTLIESVTYRLGMHNTSDNPTRYMDEAELEAWRQRDPIDRLAEQILAGGHASEGDLAIIREAQLELIESSFRTAEEMARSVDEVASVFDHAYASLSPRLEQQRAEASGGGARG